MDDLELTARYIAAKKMGLVKDPEGHRLPDDLWRQCEDQARKLLEITPLDQVMDIIDLTIHPA